MPTHEPWRSGRMLDAATARKTVRPRFDAEDVRILLAAMHLYAIREQTSDVLDLLARVDALSQEVEPNV